jgi:hypothetical protein
MLQGKADVLRRQITEVAFKGFLISKQQTNLGVSAPADYGNSFDGSLSGCLGLYLSSLTNISPEYPASPCAASSILVTLPTIFAIQLVLRPQPPSRHAWWLFVSDLNTSEQCYCKLLRSNRDLHVIRQLDTKLDADEIQLFGKSPQSGPYEVCHVAELKKAREKGQSDSRRR